ncbi:MAG TPA: molecular chaperone TorD family protein [Ramlibacter sp.]|nr:molecular chaperone TorD family protein [Ramlibacter sp.]
MQEALLCAQEQDRADVYALLAALLLRPEPALVEGLARLAEVDGDEPLDLAWNALVQAARRGPRTVSDEHEALFVAAGTPRLNPYQCYYVAGWLMDKPLAARRQDLQRIGLARLPGATELEDHLGVLCETMRVLVMSGHPLAVQAGFFSAHLAGWGPRCLDEIACASAGGFYAALAAFARHFLEAEGRHFSLEDVPSPQHPPRTSRHAATAA